MKKLVKKYSRSIITGVLAFLMMFQAVMPQISNTAYADSNELRKAFIQLKKGQSVVDIDKGQIDTQTLNRVMFIISSIWSDL